MPPMAMNSNDIEESGRRPAQLHGEKSVLKNREQASMKIWSHEKNVQIANCFSKTILGADYSPRVGVRKETDKFRAGLSLEENRGSSLQSITLHHP